MFKITIKRKAALELISAKYKEGMEDIKQAADVIAHSLQLSIYGFYVRGSVALGSTNAHSDLDVVVLINKKSQTAWLFFKKLLKALLRAKLRTYEIGVKVFGVDARGNALPVAGEKDAELAKKHLNWDLFANGMCYAGNRIPCQEKTYANYQEFRETNKHFWGEEIKELLQYIPESNQVHVYYHLIKKCLRLASYVSNQPITLYCGSLEDCYHFAKKLHLAINEDLDFIYSIVQSNPEQSIDYCKMNLASSIKRVVNYIFSIP